jgi:acyl-CoA oxidase
MLTKIAHSESILVYNNFEELKGARLSESTLKVMWDLFRLYALYTMESDARTFSVTGAVSPETLDSLQDKILDLMTTKIRPHAVKLVDSWAIPDFLLNSALGRYDGKVYETIYNMAHRQNPLNKTTFNVNWQSEEIVLGSGDGGRHILAKL